jgi:Dephospho-CoA kinase
MKIGITGSLSSGKSSVAKNLSKKTIYCSVQIK